MEQASAPLDADERRWFEDAVAAKLLELAAYRPYELEAGDCAFIGRVARHGAKHLPAGNRAEHVRRLSGTAARLASRGRFADAVSMLPASIYPAFALRYAARLAMPGGCGRSCGGGAGTAPVK